MTKALWFLNTGTGRNLGDRAMLINVLRLARRELPGQRLLVSADAPSWLADEFSAQRTSMLIHVWGRWLAIAEWLRLPDCVSRRLAPIYYLLATSFCLALSFAPTALRKRVRGMEGDFIRSLADADCVYFSGGGYLTDDGKTEARAVLLTGWMAHMRGATVVMTGQGLGPFHSVLTRYLLKRAIQTARVVITRERQASAQCLSEMNVAPTAWQAGVDDACSLPMLPVAKSSHPVLAVNCRVSSFHAGSDLVARVFEELIHRHLARGYRVRLFVFQEQHRAERVIYERWTAIDPELVEIVQTTDPRELRSELAGVDRAIGVAYHFALFALLAGLPLVSVYKGEYYRAKFAGLADHFCRQDILVDQTDLTADRLMERLDSMERTNVQRRADFIGDQLSRRCNSQILRALHAGVGSDLEA